MTPAPKPAMPWVDVYHDIRIYQKNWEPIGFTEFSTPGPTGEIEIHIRIRRRTAASGPRVGGAL